MPAEQRGEAIRLRSGWWVLHYRDASGRRQRVRTSEGRIARFKTKTAALNQYRDVIAPQLRGERPVTAYTLGEFVPIFLERHAIGVRERTISTLCDHLRHPITAFGEQPLAELEHMTDEIAAWQVHLPFASSARDRPGIPPVPRCCRPLGTYGRESREGCWTQSQDAAAHDPALHPSRTRRDRC